MRKYSGWCPRCGNTTVGIKRMGWRGSKAARYSMHPEKKGDIKCLSCQRCDGVTT